MTPALQQTQHPARVATIDRLTENLVVHDDSGIGREDSGAWSFGRRRLRLVAGEPAHVVLGRLGGPRGLVDRRGQNGELKPGGFQQLGAPRRRRREHEIHVNRDDTLGDVNSLTTLADNVLPALLARAPLTPEKIDFSWRLAAGAPVHRACTVALRNGTLTVKVPDRAWAREIDRSADVIVARMQRMLGADAVRRLDCRIEP